MWVVGRGRHARVRHDVGRVVGVVRVGRRPLLRRPPLPQPPVPVVLEGAELPLLVDLLDLIARVVGVLRRRVGGAVPVQLLHLCEPPQRVLRVTLLSPVLVLCRRDLTARAPAPAVAEHACRPVRVGCHQRTIPPVVGLERDAPSSRVLRGVEHVVAGRVPVRVDLRRVRVLDRPPHLVVDDVGAGEPPVTAGMVRGGGAHAPRPVEGLP